MKRCPCGQSFDLHAGTGGHNRKFCDDCRARNKHGAQHQRYRRATVDAAYGTPCCRCGVIMYYGEQIHLDHDDEHPGSYLGYSHARCNSSAGGKKIAKLKNDAYRASKGLPPLPSESAGSSNGTRREDAPRRSTVTMGRPAATREPWEDEVAAAVKARPLQPKNGDQRVEDGVLLIYFEGKWTDPITRSSLSSREQGKHPSSGW